MSKGGGGGDTGFKNVKIIIPISRKMFLKM
jgi:hypothetical protein